MLMADFTRTATPASITAGYGLAVLVFLAPYFHLFFFSALDASLTHLSVVFNLRFRKLSVLPEDDVEAESEYAEGYKDESSQKYLH